MGKYKLLKADEFAALLVADLSIQLVDVRTVEEFASGRIESSRNIDYKRSGFKAEAEKLLNPKKKVAVYCRSGMRSAAAAKILSSMGYDVVDLAGGFMAWQAREAKKQ